MEPLKIYSSSEWMTEGSRVILMLQPYFGSYEVSDADPDSGRFDAYLKEGKDIFSFAEELQHCDIAVYPQEYTGTRQSLEHLKQIASVAEASGKQLLVFYNADDDSDIPVDNCLIFRTSFYKSSQKQNEWALPGWSLDFIGYFQGKRFNVLDPGKPTVSYCGYIDYVSKGLKDRIKSFLRPQPDTQEERAKYRRGEACRRLSNNPGIKTNFIIRNGFWAHGMDDKKAARKQYAENMIGSLYGIVTRGGGNFSYRLYELLSCGRIPVFINTDSVLPFDSLIDWKKQVVWVEENELKQIDKILLDFHTSHTAEELKTLQLSNRKLYEEFISPVGFHRALAGFLKEKIDKE